MNIIILSYDTARFSFYLERKGIDVIVILKHGTKPKLGSVCKNHAKILQ